MQVSVRTRVLFTVLLAMAANAVAYPVVVSSAEDKPAAKTVSKTYNDLTLELPESWKEQETTSTMRIGQFAVPATAGDKADGEVAIFFFQGGGGGVSANVTRWIGQFEESGRSVKLFEGKSTQGDYTLVEITGTYKKPVGPPIQMKSKPMPGWKMHGAIVQTKGGPYFVKFDGPEKTVDAAGKDFRAAFGADLKTETEKSTEEKPKDDKPGKSDK